MAIIQNLKKFLDDLKSFRDGRVLAEMRVLQRAVVLRILTGVVIRTPVRTGHARRNWQISRGSPITSVLPGVDPNGTQVTDEGLSQIANVRAFDVVYISNNVHYILFLENGTPKMAPIAMVAKTLAEIRSVFGG